MKKLLHCLLILSMFLQSSGIAFAATNPNEGSDEQSPISPYDSENVTPIVDSFSYDPHVITVPQLNSGPNPVVVGDELVQVAFVDDFGQLYDTQANLTKKQLKIFLHGVVIASSVLSDADVIVFRNSGENVDSTKLAIAIIGGVIAGILLFAVSIAYNDAIEERDCKRSMASAWNTLAGEMRDCKLRGGSFDVTNAPSEFDCGASASSSCH